MATPQTPMIPLSDDRLTYWTSAIKKARDKRKEIATKYDWDGNLERYEPHAKSGEINIGVDFSDVEAKKAALLFDTPSVSLTDVSAGLEQAVAVHQELLNTLLGPEHADAQPTALKAIFNCLCPSGIGPVLVGYHCTKQSVDGVIDPLTGQAVPLPEGTKVPPELGLEKVKQEIPIHEKWFVSPLSPKSLLLPAELKDTAYQRAASWIGYEWQKPASQVRREFDLPADWKGANEHEDKPYFERDETPHEEAAGDPLVSGVTIWYRAELEAKPGEVIHPELVRVLTMVGNKAVDHRDSPDQTLITDGPDSGRLTPDSMIGFPIRPLVLRDLSDSAWIPSDCSQTAALTKEQNKYRTIALRKRDTNVQVIAYETREGVQAVVDEAKKTGPEGGVRWLPVPEGTLSGGTSPFVEVTKATQGREAYQDQELIRQDRARILGIDNNQAGVNTTTKRTATESSIVQRNTDARFEQERQRVLRWYLHDIVRPFDALVLRYCDERKAVEILGPQKGAFWFSQKQNLAGGYRYTVQMDSGKYLDVEASRRQMLNVVNFAAKSPFVNQAFLWQKFCEVFGYDPTQFLAQPEPPKPEPPKVNLAFNGQDLASPQGPVVLAILQQLGVQIDPAAIQAMQNAQMLMAQQQMMQAALGESAKQETHGGGADKAERIDQHNLDITGKLPGMGMA